MTRENNTLKQPQHGTDLENWLSKQITDTGRVEGVYSGFEITVKDETKFPWASVFHALIKSDHEVWIIEKKGKLKIMTQASID